MSTTSMFPCWAIVEVMGHQRYAGMVHEQQVAGVGMLRVDIPAIVADGRCCELEPYTKLIGVQSIYALTPCTEESARQYAAMIRKRPFELFTVPGIGVSAKIDDIDDDDIDGNAQFDDDVDTNIARLLNQDHEDLDHEDLDDDGYNHHDDDDDEQG